MTDTRGEQQVIDVRDAPQREDRRRDEHQRDDRKAADLSRAHASKDKLVWRADPVELALEGSRLRRESADPPLPEPFCLEVGRRMLLAQLRWPEWILRRVEKASFDGDRCVHRRISLELLVPEDAPLFHGSDDKDYWLVPLSTMRRRTLVDFHLDDEEERSIPMLGIRLEQQLDESVLLAAAATAPGLRERDHPRLQEFIRDVVAGQHDEVMKRKDQWEGCTPQAAFLEPLRGDRLFRAALTRLWTNFTLYVFLPVEKGRHRVLWMSFDEPTDWRYQRPGLAPAADDRHEYVYEPALSAPVRNRLHRLAAAFGLRPTRVRFLTPGTENAASYHFELEAPKGLQIVKASLVAGRPNDPDRHVSADHVVGHSPTLGLHAVEVPPGSLSRAQVDVRVPTSGWLTTLLISCWLVFGVMTTVVFHTDTAELDSWSNEKITNVVVILITVSAGFAALIAQRDVSGTGARMLTTLRALGVLSMSLPVVMSGFLIYGGENMRDGPRDIELLAIRVLTAFALIIAVLVLAAWIASLLPERQGFLASPWDMTSRKASDAPTNLHVALKRYRFDTPAIGVESAEGWHERYFWTDDAQVEAVARLKELGLTSLPVEPAGGCSRLRSAGERPTACDHECAATTPPHRARNGRMTG
jgi:hypothetical protein